MDKFLEKLDKKPIKVTMTKLANLKVALNDLVIDYLNFRNIKQNNLVTDIKILIGFSSAILASVTAYISMHYEFFEIKYLITAMVLVYFLINGSIELYTYITGGYIYKGLYKDDTLYVYNEGKACETDYKLKYIYKYKTRNMKWSIFDLFYDNGCLDHRSFIKDLDEFFSLE